MHTKVRFATFNTLHGRIPKESVDIEAFVDSVADLEADFVGLQEVDKGMLRSHRVDMAAVAAGRIGGQHAFGKASRRWDLGLYGNALVSRNPVHGIEVLKLPRRGWKRERRVAILAKLSAAGTTWNVANTHLSLHKDESAEQLAMLFGKFARINTPCVVMGDFNRHPDEVIPLVPPEWTVVDSAATFPSWDPDQRIDYLVIKNATALSSEVRCLKVSDHCALIADLESATNSH